MSALIELSFCYASGPSHPVEYRKAMLYWKAKYLGQKGNNKHVLWSNGFNSDKNPGTLWVGRQHKRRCWVIKLPYLRLRTKSPRQQHPAMTPNSTTTAEPQAIAEYGMSPERGTVCRSSGWESGRRSFGKSGIGSAGSGKSGMKFLSRYVSSGEICLRWWDKNRKHFKRPRKEIFAGTKQN